MEPSTLQAIQAGLTPRTNEFIPQKPTPRQAAFLLLPQREALYGGAAGGGKSSALLIAALQYVDVPGYSALLLRRTFADLALPGALMDRAAQWLSGTNAKWNGQEKTWTFPSGATLSFGYLENENHKYRYQGAEFQFVGFDELTQFTSTQYTYLFSRLRRLRGVSIPVRMRAATNPGGAGHGWVYQRFFIEGRKKGRIFVPARLDDNPYLDRDEYLQSLRELDYVTRQRLQNGDWTVNEDGGLFKRQWFNVVDAPPRILRRVRYWDLASTQPSATNPDPDYTAGVLLGYGEDRRFYVLDVRLARVSPRGVENLVKQTAAIDGRDTEIYIEQEPGASGVTLIDHYQSTVLIGYAARGNKPSGDKVTRARPVSAASEAGNVVLVRGAWNNDFLDMVCAFPNEGVHDDPVDGLSGAHEKLSAATSLTVDQAPGLLSDWRG